MFINHLFKADQDTLNLKGKIVKPASPQSALEDTGKTVPDISPQPAIRPMAPAAPPANLSAGMGKQTVQPGSSADSLLFASFTDTEKDPQIQVANPIQAPSYPGIPPIATPATSSQITVPGAGDYDHAFEASEVARLRNEAAQAKVGYENYKSKPYRQLLQESGVPESQTQVGRGMFGRASVDNSHKDAYGNPRPAIIKHGIMKDKEHDIAKRMGELGIGPVVHDFQRGVLSIFDPRVQHAVSEMEKIEQRKKLPYGDFYKYDQLGNRVYEPDLVPMHHTEDRQKVFSDFVQEHPKNIEFENSKKLQDNKVLLETLDPQKDQKLIEHLKKRQIELQQDIEDEKLDHLDPKAVEALSEAGVYYPHPVIDTTRRLALSRQDSPSDYRLGSRIGMQYLKDHVPLGKYLTNLEPDEVTHQDDILSRLKVGVDTMDMLNRMNREGFNHNDFHARNVLHNGENVKILDFGLASPLKGRSSDWNKYHTYGRQLNHLMGMLDKYVSNNLPATQYGDYAKKRLTMNNYLDTLHKYLNTASPTSDKLAISLDPKEHSENLHKIIHHLKKTTNDMVHYLK